MRDSTCPNCGGSMIGDGFTMVLHCENAEEEDYFSVEPDACPIPCRQVDNKDLTKMLNSLFKETILVLLTKLQNVI